MYKKVKEHGKNTVEVTNVMGFSSNLVDNPMDKILFYSDEKQNPFSINSQDISKLLSKTFFEVETLIYEKH